MKTSTSQRWWIVPVVAFLAGAIAAIGERRPGVPWAEPVVGASFSENAIDCQTREALQFEFIALADLERQARESATSHGSSDGK
jgi:hypothetical protein